MASGQIKRSEIAEQDLYKEIRDSAKKTIQVLDQMNVQLKQTASTIKTDLNAGMQKSTASINKMSKAVAQADASMKKSVQIDKEKAQATKVQIQAERELEKLKQDQERTAQQKMRTDQQANKEKERQIKLQQRSAKQARDEQDAYKQLTKATRDQKNESKRLGAELLKLEQAGKKNTKEYRKLQQQYDKVTRSARKGDQQLKKLDKTVGDNFRNVGNYRSALGKLTGALSSMGLAFGSAMVFRSVFETVKNFDQAQANLASVLGVSRIEMQGLTEDAKEYGSTTRFTASQVSELQLEFAKLGFTQQEIRDVTSATLDLASATGTDLAESATVVGATVRGFGLATTETARVTDVMSKSFSSSSLDMQKFSTAMASVAPIAKNAGFSIEQTTAMIGTLTDRGIDASTAGTGLRNVFLELTKRGITFEQAMLQISTATDSNAKSLELFGKRGAVIGSILSENGLAIDELTAKLMDSEGATARMAQMQIDTLGGSLDILKSAFEGYILKQNEAGGAGDKLKSIIRELAQNLEVILNTLMNLGQAFITFKAITMLQIGANRLLNSSFIQGARGMGVMKGAVRGLGSAFKALGGFIKSNLIGIALFAIMDMVREYQKLQSILNTVDDNANDLAQSMNTLTNNEKAETDQANMYFDALKKTNAGSEERDLLMRKINSQYGTTLTNLKDEIEFQKQLALAQEKVIANIREKTKAEGVRITFEMAQRAKAESGFEVEKAERILDDFRDGGITQDVLTTLFDKFGVTSENDLIETLNAWYKVDSQNRRILIDATAEWEKLQISLATKKSPEQVSCETRGGVWDEATKTCKLGGSGGGGGSGDDGEPDKLTDLTRQIENEDIIQMQNDEKREIKKAETDAKRRIEDLKKVKAYRSQKKKLTTEIEESLQLKLSEIDKKYRDKERAREQKNLKADIDARVKAKQDELRAIDDTIANVTQRENVATQIDNLQIEQIEKNRDIQLKNTELTEGEKKKIIIDALYEINTIVDNAEQRKLAIQQKYLTQLENAYTDAEKREKLRLLNSSATQLEIDQAMLDFQIKQLEKLIQAKKKLGVDTLDDEIKLAELKRTEISKQDKLFLDDQKKMVQDQIAIVQSLTQAFNYYADQRIAKVQEEIDMAQKRYDSYADLAKNGNIQAQQSMATEAKIIAEQNRKKEQMEKRKQRIALASDALQAYLRNSEDPNVKNPLLKTFTDITMLTQFVQNLPFFEDGTENTGSHGQGVDGRGGFHAILHPNERVLTKAQNAMIGDISNDDLAHLALKHQNGKIDGVQANIIAQNNDKRIVEKLESLEKTIKNKPVSNIELERIIDGTLQVVRSTTTNGKTIYNRYKIK